MSQNDCTILVQQILGTILFQLLQSRPHKVRQSIKKFIQTSSKSNPDLSSSRYFSGESRRKLDTDPLYIACGTTAILLTKFPRMHFVTRDLKKADASLYNTRIPHRAVSPVVNRTS